MILILGGLNGFVGSNTTEALAEQEIDCVVTRHENAEAPRFLEKHIDRHVFIEPADATSVDYLRKIGLKHQVDGIIDVASVSSSAAKTQALKLRAQFDKPAAVFQVAEDWKVRRLTFSSTAGLYFGAEAGPMNEDRPLPLSSPLSIVARHKLLEVAASEFAKGSGISTVCVRLG